MKPEEKKRPGNVPRLLLFGTGILFLLSALVFNEFLMSLIARILRGNGLNPVEVGKVRGSQLTLFIIAIIFFAFSTGIEKIRPLKTLFRHRLAANLLLSFLTLFTPITILELTLRPLYHKQKTTIYIEDDDLGWRLKPNSRDVWGGVRVEINGKGLRGPELAYVKKPGVKRILYLGDSVTFGYRLKHDAETYPHLIEKRLEQGRWPEIETINAGVGGYSPWQEHLYLVREGMKYEPDLVTVSFILNDVTEKLELSRFGGSGRGFQLTMQVASKLDRFLSRSAILYFVKKLRARIRFGRDVQEGAARQEILNVETLVAKPGDQIDEAWKMTLLNLENIYSTCKAADIPVLLIIFPYAFQFEDPAAMSRPQEIVKEHASKNGIPYVDLLPHLSTLLEAEDKPTSTLFLDANHPSFEGNRAISEIVAGFIEEKKLLR